MSSASATISKLFCVGICVLLSSLVIYYNPVQSQQIEYYASRYDHLDVETILNNRRMVNYYAACLLNRGPCTPQGVEFKRILPEALRTKCAKCTEKQKTVTYRSIKRLQKEYPKVWSQLVALWDPNDVYVKEFEDSFEQENTIPSRSPAIFDRFGGGDEDDENDGKPASTNVVASTQQPLTTISRTYPPAPPVTSTSTSSTPSTLRTSTINVVTTNRPIATQTRAPTPLETIGTNFQATVSLVKAIKKFALEMYQHKLDSINRVLSSGR